jgi:hypothetical protein
MYMSPGHKADQEILGSSALYSLIGGYGAVASSTSRADSVTVVSVAQWANVVDRSLRNAVVPGCTNAPLYVPSLSKLVKGLLDESEDNTFRQVVKDFAGERVEFEARVKARLLNEQSVPQILKVLQTDMTQFCFTQQYQVDAWSSQAVSSELHELVPGFWPSICKVLDAHELISA